MKKPVVLLCVLVLLLLWPASAVLADGPRIYTDSGRIFVEEDVTLQPGETFKGDLGIFDGDLTMPRGSVVTGDVFVTNGDIEIGHLTASLCHLGNIATQLGRSLTFDPNTEQVIDDDQANALLGRKYRDHWGAPRIT